MSLMEVLAYQIIALIVSLTLHEFAHAWAGDFLGDTTARSHGRLTLNPAAHIDPFFTLLLPLFLIFVGSPVVFGAAKPVPFNPWAVRYGKWGAALVALAGPLTNLLIAVFLSLWLRLFSLPSGPSNLLMAFIAVNIAFFVFNMIPFPPLDGSRVLYAAAPLGLRRVMDSIERAGVMAIVIFMFVGFPIIRPLMQAAVLGLGRILLPNFSF